MSRKPSVNTSPVASKYAASDERIIEYSSPAGGGLIALRVTGDRLAVDLYRHDPTVDIRVGSAGLSGDVPPSADGTPPAAPPAKLNEYPVVAFVPLIRADPNAARPAARVAPSGVSTVPGEWIVVCERTDPELAGSDRRWCVWTAFMSPREAGRVICEQGAYDLTFTEAIGEMADRAKLALLLTSKETAR